MFRFLKRPHPHSGFILCAWYTICMVLILIKSIVLGLFLAFITLSDLYYPHHPPSEGCTFCSKKKAFYMFSVCKYSCVWFFHLGCYSIAFTLAVMSCASVMHTSQTSGLFNVSFLLSHLCSSFHNNVVYEENERIKWNKIK